ncbi:MAG: hypothetical protein Q8L53_10550 [Aestuariivirga sp.]|nr:hypothetical protein [Aestuariivirga sp.]
MSFDSQSKGQLAFTAWIEKFTLKDGRIPPDLLNAFTNCGFVARQTTLADTLAVDAILEFSSSTVLGTDLDCLPIDWSHREVRQGKYTGLLYVNYETIVWLEQGVVLRPSDSYLFAYFTEADEETKTVWSVVDKPFFPRFLAVEVPGQVTSVQNNSELFASSFDTSYTGNQAVIRLYFSESEEDYARFLDIAEALNDGKEVEIPAYKYKFVIASRETRFDIGTILTVIGAILGSGVLMRFWVWFRSRKFQK